MPNVTSEDDSKNKQCHYPSMESQAYHKHSRRHGWNKIKASKQDTQGTSIRNKHQRHTPWPCRCINTSKRALRSKQPHKKHTRKTLRFTVFLRHSQKDLNNSNSRHQVATRRAEATNHKSRQKPKRAQGTTKQTSQEKNNKQDTVDSRASEDQEATTHSRQSEGKPK